MKREEGVYLIKRVDKLPSKGSANYLYEFKSQNPVIERYRWNSGNWEATVIGGSSGVAWSNKTTFDFRESGEVGATAPISGNIVLDSVEAVPGIELIVHVNSETEPIISGASVVASSGNFVPNTLNIYHFIWSNSGGYVLAIQTVDNFVQLDATFTNINYLGSNEYEVDPAESYATAFAVSNSSFSGDFIFKVDTAKELSKGTMFGVSSSALNVAYNDGVNPWERTAFYSIGGNLKVVVSGGASNDSDSFLPPTLNKGEYMELKRISDNLKWYVNNIEVHDFGTVSGDLYLHISGNGPTGNIIYNPQINDL